VEAWPANDPNDVETISGAISSTHQKGVADTQLMVPMTLGANLQGPAHVRIIVENNGDAALPLTRVALEMREHKMCFDAKSGTLLMLAEDGDTAISGTVPALQTELWDRAGVAVLGAAVKTAMPRNNLPPQLSGRSKSLRYLVIAFVALGFALLALMMLRLRIVHKARG
jgi:hypothetical protein